MLVWENEIFLGPKNIYLKGFHNSNKVYRIILGWTFKICQYLDVFELQKWWFIMIWPGNNLSNKVWGVSLNQVKIITLKLHKQRYLTHYLPCCPWGIPGPIHDKHLISVRCKKQIICVILKFFRALESPK
jgi:hypothetical protein